jgi:hypothetical protein
MQLNKEASNCKFYTTYMLWKRPNTYIRLGTFSIIIVKFTWDPNAELAHGVCTRNVEILWASLFYNRVNHVQLSSFILGNDFIRTSHTDHSSTILPTYYSSILTTVCYCYWYILLLMVLLPTNTVVLLLMVLVACCSLLLLLLLLLATPTTCYSYYS